MAALVLLTATPASALTFTWTVDCPNDEVLGPITVLANTGLTGSVTVEPGVPVTVALLPNANLILVNAIPTPGIFTGTLSCTVTIDGVTVPFTRSLSFDGAFLLTVGAVTVAVNLGEQGFITLSAPEVVQIGFTPMAGIGFVISTSLFVNTTVFLGAVSVPTLSEWGMIAMLAIVLGAGLLYLRRRTPTRA